MQRLPCFIAIGKSQTRRPQLGLQQACSARSSIAVKV